MTRQLKELAWVYYLLATAHAQGKRTFELRSEKRELVEQNLENAVLLPDCDLGAFLWLEELQDWSDVGMRKRINTLQAALAQYPNSEKARCRLAERFIYRLEAPEEGLNYLAPLLSDVDCGPYSVWLAYQASSRAGDVADLVPSKYYSGLRMTW
jgi:hypothetical protein